MSRLLCEGERGGVDAVVLAALFAPDGPMIEPSISKANLGACVHALRRIRELRAAAIRDRDFDFDPEHSDVPGVWEWSGELVGWHWRRHELESYLVDPALAVPATLAIEPEADVSGYGELLLQSACDLAPYQAARWALGEVRRRLPRRLPDRPEDFKGKDFRLPQDLSAEACMSWARREIDAHRTTVPEPATLDKLYQEHLERFTAEAFSVRDALLWFSGKDFMAALARRARAANLALWSSSGALRNRVRNWIIDHPEQALHRMPEWAHLKDLVNG